MKNVKIFLSLVFFMTLSFNAFTQVTDQDLNRILEINQTLMEIVEKDEYSDEDLHTMLEINKELLTIYKKDEMFTSNIPLLEQNIKDLEEELGNTSSETGNSCEIDSDYKKYMEMQCQPCYNCAALALALCYYESTGDEKYLENAKINKKIIENYDENVCPELTTKIE